MEGSLVGALAPAKRRRRRRPIGAEIAEGVAIFEGEDEGEVGRVLADRIWGPRFSDDSTVLLSCPIMDRPR